MPGIDFPPGGAKRRPGSFGQGGSNTTLLGCFRVGGRPPQFFNQAEGEFARAPSRSPTCWVAHYTSQRTLFVNEEVEKFRPLLKPFQLRAQTSPQLGQSRANQHAQAWYDLRTDRKGTTISQRIFTQVCQKYVVIQHLGCQSRTAWEGL